LGVYRGGCADLGANGEGQTLGDTLASVHPLGVALGIRTLGEWKFARIVDAEVDGLVAHCVVMGER
jgi:hypothetical protein